MVVQESNEGTRKRFDGDQRTTRSMFFWNMMGSLCNALSSFVLLIVVSQVSGANDAGLFSLAFSAAQLLETIGLFEGRAIQTTDIEEQFPFKLFFTFRLVTSGIMMVAAVIYVLLSRFEFTSALTVLFICLYKTLDSVSDAYQGMFQLRGRIDISGQALAGRVVLSTVAFIIVLAASHSLIMASLSMVVVSVVFILGFDQVRSLRFDRVGLQWNAREARSLFRECFPLFVSSFMLSYIVNASKFSVEVFSTNEVQAYYGFLLMPAFVINLFTLFAFRPLLTPLARRWHDRNMVGFYAIIRLTSFWAIGFTVLGVVVASFAGIPLLNVISGLNLSGLEPELCLIMVGGGFNAFITIYYYVLAVVREQKLIILSYTVGFVAAFLLAPLCVSSFGLVGAVIAYVIPMGLTAGALVLASFFAIKRQAVQRGQVQ